MSPNIGVPVMETPGIWRPNEGWHTENVRMKMNSYLFTERRAARAAARRRVARQRAVRRAQPLARRQVCATSYQFGYYLLLSHIYSTRSNGRRRVLGAAAPLKHFWLRKTVKTIDLLIL